MIIMLGVKNLREGCFKKLDSLLIEFTLFVDLTICVIGL